MMHNDSTLDCVSHVMDLIMTGRELFVPFFDAFIHLWSFFSFFMISSQNLCQVFFAVRKSASLLKKVVLL